VVSGAPVEAFLRARRVRYLDSVAAPMLRDLLSAVGADLAVVGTILSFQPGPSPAVAVTARAVSPAEGLLWAGTVSLTGADTEQLFGKGRTTDAAALTRVAASRLTATLPPPGPTPARVVVASVDTRSLPRTYRAKSLREATRRVCILPFQNHAEDRGASRALDALLHRRLGERALFTVVEPAELRQAVVDQGIQSVAELDPDGLRRLGKQLGTSLFVQGTVYAYGTGTSRDGVSYPEVELYLSLVDVEAGRVLWSALHARTGREYERMLQRGAITNRVSLADQVLAEMVEALLK
jgi:hypothetical protein